MKSLMIAASLATLAVAAPAMAQDMTPTGYGTIGYAHGDYEGLDVGVIEGRIGARFGQYLGVEGELGGGVKGDTVNILGTNYDADLTYSVAGYGVGYLPVNPNFDLFARVGYGKSELDISGPFGGKTSANSWNYGVGGQYFFTDKDGIRADYTRHDFDDNQGNADVVSVSYVRKF
ncbi:MAG: porin family protein [Caulobacter sp.]|nr:porin family protein [Caulobacter sp.]